MATLELQKVTKQFGKTTALHDVSLDVRDGEFLVLLGPTGAGKTTALRCVAGLERLTQGEVLLDGAPQGTTPPALRDVVMVFQSYALYPRKTVYENMAFPLEARKMPRKEQDNLIREVAHKLRIDHYLDRKPAQLSGGQQQRVALGRAMVRHPRVYLMDEPLTNLDFQLRVEMRSELKRLQRELRGTFFYVTNDQVEAMSLADRIAVLNKGVLQQLDTPEKIYQQPKNLFVANFIGNPRMNFIDCTYDKAARQLVTTQENWRISTTDAQRTVLDKHANEKIIVGIRAEDIMLEPLGGNEQYVCEVYVVEPLGDRLLVDVRVGEMRLRVKMPPTFETKPGDRLGLNIHIDGLHFFAPDTEQRIV